MRGNRLLIGTLYPYLERHCLDLVAEADTKKVAQRVLAQLKPAQIQFLVSDQLRAKSPGEACQAFVGYLTVLNNIPEGDRARSIRAIYSNK